MSLKQRNPAITPQTFPQTQAPIVNNPLFWERLGSVAYGTDTLFFAFYYQQVTKDSAHLRLFCRFSAVLLFFVFFLGMVRTHISSI